MFILGLRAWYTVKAQAMFVEEITLNLSIFLPVPHSTISNYLYDTLVWASTHLLKLKVSHYSSHDELVNIMFSEYIRKKKRNLELKWRRQWHPTPVLLPGKSHEWRSLVGGSPWGR